MLTPKTQADIVPYWAIWITARTMDTNTPYPVGFWTGPDATTLTIPGAGSRNYYGAGAALSIEPLTYQTGAIIQTQRVSLGPLAAEVRQTFRGYDTRQAPAEIHLIMFSTTGLFQSAELAFRGVVDSFEINDGPIDNNGVSTVTCDVELVSDARMLTRTLALKQSDASQRERSPTDRFRQYADVARSVKVPWMGETDNPHRAREIR